MLFFKLGAAAGNSTMANDLVPCFTMTPQWTYSTYVVTWASDLIVIDPGKTYAVKMFYTNGSGRAVVKLISATPNGSPAVQTAIISPTSGNDSRFNRSTYAGYALGLEGVGSGAALIKGAPCSPWPEDRIVNSAQNQLVVAQCTTPYSTTESVGCYTATDSSGNTITWYKAGWDVSGVSRGIVQRNVNGVRQWTKQINSGVGESVQISTMMQLSNDKLWIRTNRGVVILNPDGTLFYGNRNVANTDPFERIYPFDPGDGYLYSSDNNDLVRIQLSSPGTAQRMTPMTSVFTSLRPTTGQTSALFAQSGSQMGKDSAGNYWAIFRNQYCDTLACFSPSWTFIRKYTFNSDAGGSSSSYRVNLLQLVCDGDYVCVVGNAPSSSGTDFFGGQFFAKLAIDGSSTGAVASTSDSYEFVVNITIQSSTTSGGSAGSWSALTWTTYSWNIGAVTGNANYDFETTLTQSTATYAGSYSRTGPVALPN